MSKEDYERKLDQVEESHRIDLFIILWIIGEVMLAFLFKEIGGWGFFFCSWIVVFVAWKLAGKKN